MPYHTWYRSAFFKHIFKLIKHKICCELSVTSCPVGDNLEKKNENHISPNQCSLSYAKHGYGGFILYPFCKAKSLSNFVFVCVLEIVRMKY